MQVEATGSLNREGRGRKNRCHAGAFNCTYNTSEAKEGAGPKGMCDREAEAAYLLPLIVRTAAYAPNS
jgi:hypothetical protein